MAKLSDEERQQLKQLRDKEKAPDTPQPGINFTLDLGSDTAWERAKQLGLVSDPNSNGDDDDDDDDDDEKDEVPKRRGYFKE